MQVVIDTNIIIAALINPSGSCYLFMDRVFSGCYDVVASEEIIREYDEVLHRAKFGFDDSNYLPDVVLDKKDLPFYVTARATNSRLVTGNIKHYPVEEMRTMIWELV